MARASVWILKSGGAEVRRDSDLKRLLRGGIPADAVIARQRITLSRKTVSQVSPGVMSWVRKQREADK